MIELTIPRQDLLSILHRQVGLFFPVSESEKNAINVVFDNVLHRLDVCLHSRINGYLSDAMGGGKILKFNYLHTTQYLIFLYYLSNTLFKEGHDELAGKIYYLNKIMNAVDIFYQVELPETFGCEHPVGSVIGRAQIGKDFYFYQNCTVGSTADKNNNYIHPVIGNNVCMYSNSAILGRCNIGDNVNIGSGTIIKNQDVPSNSTVFGISPNLCIKNSYTKYY